MDILLHTNAPWTSSGYGQQASLLAPRLRDAGHRVGISCFFGLEGGILEWEGMPCYPTDQTRFGNQLLPAFAEHFTGGSRRDCLVLTLMDVWVLTDGLRNFDGLKFASWVPIDHYPAPPLVLQFLELSKATPIAMSRFGEQTLKEHGLDPLYVPHGIETNTFKPMPADRDEFRRGLNIPEDAFVVGMVANNQGIPSRKAFPEVFQAFAEFHRKKPDSILYVHADVWGRNHGVNLLPLAAWAGVPGDALRTTDQTMLNLGVSRDGLAAVYNCFDVLAHTSRGEGFGLASIEAQACGVPIITTDWTAMTELCGAGWLVDGQRDYTGQGAAWKIPFIGDIYEALLDAYDTAGTMGDKAREFAEAYDVDKVFDQYWRPVLETLDLPVEVPALGNGNRAQRRAKAKIA